MASFKIENHGSIFLFRPADEESRELLESIVDSEAQWFGGALAVEHRYARDLAHGLIDEYGADVS